MTQCAVGRARVAGAPLGDLLPLWRALIVARGAKYKHNTMKLLDTAKAEDGMCGTARIRQCVPRPVAAAPAGPRLRVD